MTLLNMPSAPPFHSARLAYRAFTDADSALLEQMYAGTSASIWACALATRAHWPLGHTQTDPYTLAYGLGGFCAPQSPAALLELGQGAAKNSLLSVVACLPLSNDEPTKPGVPIGWLNLGPKGSANSLHRRAEIGVVFLPEQQGKGYGTEAVAWLLAIAFERAGLHRVGLECFATNIGARKVYEKWQVC